MSLRIARRYAAAGQLEAARTHCADLLRQRPDDRTVLEFLADLQERLGDTDAALETLTALRRLAPDIGAYARRAAVLAAASGDTASAIRSLHERLSAVPEDIAAAAQWVALHPPDPGLANDIAAIDPDGKNRYLQRRLSSERLFLDPSPAHIEARLRLFDLPEIALYPAEILPFRPVRRQPENRTQAATPPGFQHPSGMPETGFSGLVHLANSVLLNGEGWILDGDVTRTDAHTQTPAEASFYLLEPLSGPRSMLAPAAARIDTPAIVIDGAANYFHWMLDCLTRAVTARDTDPGRDRKVAFCDMQKAFQSETLDRMGIGSDVRIPMNWPGAVQMADAVVPVLPAWDRFRVLASLGPRLADPDTRPAGERIYLRRGAGSRELLGEATLETSLLQRGYRVLDCATLTVGQQVAAMRDAKEVIAPHGAALTNLAFAPPGCRVLELMSSAWSMPFFQNLCAVLGHDRTALALAAQETPSSYTLHWNTILDDTDLAAIERWIAT